jgi:hypothetical protein
MLTHNRKPRCTCLMRDTNFREEGINPGSLLFPYSFMTLTFNSIAYWSDTDVSIPILTGLPHVNIHSLQSVNPSL